MNVYTIGFTKKGVERFFDLVEGSGTKRIVDVRLRPDTQLSGFAKSSDLAYLLKRVAGIDYVHLPELAPDKETLDAYRNSKAADAWDQYELQFLELMRLREVEKSVPRDIIEDGCLLCSEAEPDRCHRRLVVEYLASHWGNLQVHHLQ